MLFDGVIGAVARARAALRVGETAARGEATTRALRLLDEGLKASLDPRGGELSANLEALYEYMSHRLLSANSSGDDARYAEVAAMLEQLRDAWRRIAPGARSARQAA
jgi:flagellar protein FliS